MKADTRPEHEWLKNFVGEWDVVVAPDTAPDQAPGHWVERGRMIGDVWIAVEGEGELRPGDGISRTLFTLGFDPARAKYVGAWIGSMLMHQWVYEGTINAAGELVLDCEGPDFTNPGQILPYQDIYSFDAAGGRHLRSQLKKPGSDWEEFMRMSYKRR